MGCRHGIEGACTKCQEADELTRLRAENSTLRARLEAAEKDAARYRQLWKDRHVTLLTAFFGNGCVNKTQAEVESILDAAIAELAKEGKS